MFVQFNFIEISTSQKIFNTEIFPIYGKGVGIRDAIIYIYIYVYIAIL